MATKAELEVELVKLRSELKDLRDLSTLNAAASDDPAKQSPDQSPSKDTDSEIPAAAQEQADITQSLKDGHFEDALHQLVEELEDFPSRKPLLTALGALVVGYLMGRSGNRG